MPIAVQKAINISVNHLLQGSPAKAFHSYRSITLAWAYPPGSSRFRTPFVAALRPTLIHISTPLWFTSRCRDLSRSKILRNVIRNIIRTPKRLSYRTQSDSMIHAPIPIESLSSLAGVVNLHYLLHSLREDLSKREQKLRNKTFIYRSQGHDFRYQRRFRNSLSLVLIYLECK